MKCYVTFDVKTERYSVPVFFDNDEEAKRAYSFTINQMIGAPESVDKSLLYFKKDIQLQCIGEYDQDSGSIVPGKTKALGSLDSIYSDFKASYMTSLKEGIPVEEVNKRADEIINESFEEKEKSIVEQFNEDEDPSEKKITLKRKKEEI